MTAYPLFCYELSGMEMQTEATYIIHTDGTDTYAIDGSNGGELTSGADAPTVINDAITALGAAGGLIFIKRGTYTLSSLITLHDNVILEGESAGASTGTALTTAGWSYAKN